MFNKIFKFFTSIFNKKRLCLIRPYIVTYLTTFGSMTIAESEYRCFACCKYHAYLKFIEATKDEFGHYSARENRTPLTYHLWTNDIKVDEVLVNKIKLERQGMREIYYRGTNNTHEPDIVAAGNIRCSLNHITGKTEPGLSVSRDILTLCDYFAIIYKVVGEPLPISGSDGEVLLDINTVRLVVS